jgi:hypothetical protein
MKILFYDVIQMSDVNETLKTPSLADFSNINSQLVINLNQNRNINSIGIGNTNGVYFNIQFNDINNTVFNLSFTENGLYCFNKTVSASKLTITTNAAYLGRIAAGLYCNIPTALAKEPGYNSTSEPRTTLSGQVIAGLGGYNYKTVSLDSRYKIDEFIMGEIKNGYKYIGMGYPFFIDLTSESYKLPFSKLYATEKNQRNLIFESGIKKYLYSKRWEFEEKF